MKTSKLLHPKNSQELIAYWLLFHKHATSILDEECLVLGQRNMVQWSLFEEYRQRRICPAQGIPVPTTDPDTTDTELNILFIEWSSKFGETIEKLFDVHPEWRKTSLTPEEREEIVDILVM